MDDKQQLRDLRAAVEAVIEDDHEGSEMLAILIVDRVVEPIAAEVERLRTDNAWLYRHYRQATEADESMHEKLSTALGVEEGVSWDALVDEVKRLNEERDRALDALVPGNRDILLMKLTDAEADRDRARDAAVALEQENAAARALHAERVITEHDHETSRDTDRTWSICTGCSSRDIIDALDDGELIEEYEGTPWPCATYVALTGGEG